MIISSNIINKNDEKTIIDNYFNRIDGPIGVFNYNKEAAPISYQYINKKF